MAMWEVPLSARELFVGLRLGFVHAGQSAEAGAVTAGDQIRFNRNGRGDLEGRILQTSSKGAVVEVMADLTRWLLTPVSYSEKRRSAPVTDGSSVWIVRERLP